MRTLRIPAEDQRTAGKPPGSEPGLVLQSPVLLSAEWEGGSDNYWGGPDQQDVTHLKGGGGLYGVQAHRDQLQLHTVGKSEQQRNQLKPASGSSG